MRIIVSLIGVVITAILLTAAITINSDDKKIIIKPSTNVKQGQTIFVEVKTDKKLDKPYLTYNGKKIKLYKQNQDTYRGLLGVEAVQKAGKYSIAIKDDTGFLNEQSYINVIPVKFPIQNIRVSGGKSGLGATKYELNKVQKAKDTITDSAFWNNPPFNSPTDGCIISVYGLNRYYNGKPSGNYHKGVDIKAPTGRTIRSITDGKVVIAEQFRLHGGTVAIDHGQGLMSIYLHMSKILVKPGDVVKQDQTIGKVGSTGFATGPHLHWGLYINGIPVDPMENWIKPVPKC